MKTVATLLERNGPSLTSVLASDLEKLLGITNQAARKQIERAKKANEILELPIALPHNERFVYLAEQRRESGFKRTVVQAFQNSGSAYRFGLQSLDARGGMITGDLWPTFSGFPLPEPQGGFPLSELELGGLGTPIEARTKRPPRDAHAVLDTLMNLRLIAEDPPDSGFLKLAEDTGFSNLQANVAKSRLVSEAIALEQVRNWLIAVGLTSSGAVRLRPDKPQFASYQWDLTAPSYVNPFLRYGEDGQKKHGYVVADIILGATLQTQHIEYFVHKAQSIKKMQSIRKKLGRCMFMLVGDHFQYQALMTGRESGLVFTTPDNLFGRNFGELLRKIELTLDDPDNVLEEAPDVVPRLIRAADDLVGETGGLRGIAFELLISYCCSKADGAICNVREKLPLGGEKVSDIDVLGIVGKSKILCHELKAVKPTKQVPLEDVKYWYEQQIPAMERYFSSRPSYRGARREYRFWTTGSFSQDAHNYLLAQSPVSAFDMSFFDGKLVAAYVKVSAGPSFYNAIKELFAA